MSGMVLAYGKAEETELKKMLLTLEHRGKTRKIEVDSGVGIALISSDEFLPNQIALDGHVCWMEGDSDHPMSGEELYLRYLRYGTSCLHKLNGAFAFAIAQGGKLFVACDPFGQKTLYYGVHRGTLYFASEIKALMGVVRHIKVVPGGHYFHSDEGWNRYFSPKERKSIPCDNERACQSMRNLITKSVRTWAGEAEIGVFLSGGLDSSILAATARELGSRVQSFAIGSDESEDLSYAQGVSAYLGLNHHQLVFTRQDIEAILPRVIYHLETFDLFAVRNGMANYLLAKMAKAEGISRIFSGEGSDLLFGPGVNNSTTAPQRVDRITSAFSLEGCLPFMDRHLADFVFSLPEDCKTQQGQPEKWVLRKAFCDLLPEKTLWRKGNKCSRGIDFDLVRRFVESSISDEDFQAEQRLPDGQLLRSKEELWYYRVFREMFPDNTILDVVERT